MSAWAIRLRCNLAAIPKPEIWSHTEHLNKGSLPYTNFLLSSSGSWLETLILTCKHRMHIVLQLLYFSIAEACFHFRVTFRILENFVFAADTGNYSLFQFSLVFLFLQVAVPNHAILPTPSGSLLCLGPQSPHSWLALTSAFELRPTKKKSTPMYHAKRFHWH